MLTPICKVSSTRRLQLTPLSTGVEKKRKKIPPYVQSPESASCFQSQFRVKCPQFCHHAGAEYSSGHGVCSIPSGNVSDALPLVDRPQFGSLFLAEWSGPSSSLGLRSHCPLVGSQWGFSFGGAAAPWINHSVPLAVQQQEGGVAALLPPPAVGQVSASFGGVCCPAPQQ